MTKRTNNATVTTYSVNSLNQVTTDGMLNFGYDGNGNRSSQSSGGASITYTYDDENQMVQAETDTLYTPSASRWKTMWAYDARGRVRVREDYSWYGPGSYFIRDRSARYLYDGMRVIQERNENNTPQVTYTRGLDLAGSWERAGGIGGLLARTAHSGANGVTLTTAFYHADGNGNVTYLLKLDQTAGATYQFDPYGRLLASSGTLAAANTYRFSSKEVMLASGFYSFGYRFYDPATQRWLNRDPIGEEGGVNLYGYVGNNPLTYWDAFGLTIVYDFDPMPGDDPNSNGPYARNFDDGSNLFKPLLKLNPCQLYKEMDRIKATLAKKPWWKRFDPMDEAGFDTTYFKGTEGDDRQYYSYDGKIYADNEINYFGIGMYDSWAGKPDWASDSQTSFWKKWQYNQSPNENTYYWLQQGRSNYGPPDNSNIPTIPEGRRRN